MISVVIPTFNGLELLKSCLTSLREQLLPPDEIIVVDDGSTDGTVQVIPSLFPEVQIVGLQRNGGFARAANVGVSVAAGDFIVLLNNDVELDRAFLSEIVLGAWRWPEAGWLASKILLQDRRDIIHSAGDFYRYDGRPVNRGVWQKDLGQYDAEEEVFGACAAACLYRREFLEQLCEGDGPFDADLFMYLEDVDLNLRARLLGQRCFYIPAAVAYHRLSSTGGGVLASYYCGRNFLLVAAKDLPNRVLVEFWPSIMRAQLGYVLESLRHFREAAARARLRGQLRGLSEMRRFRLKGSPWRKKQTITDDELRAWLLGAP